jgi:hypothetical protein
MGYANPGIIPGLASLGLISGPCIAATTDQFLYKADIVLSHSQIQFSQCNLQLLFSSFQVSSIKLLMQLRATTDHKPNPFDKKFLSTAMKVFDFGSGIGGGSGFMNSRIFYDPDNYSIFPLY